MRVWDIHPGYLSRQSLLGQHAEIHALFAVIDGQKKGYAAHPETLRWQENPARLIKVHDLTVLEMLLRGFNHASPLKNSACSDQDSKTKQNCDPLQYIDHPVDQVSILRRKYLAKNQQGRIPLPKNGFELWANYKYSVMSRGYNYYKEIQGLLRGQYRCPLEEAGHLFDQIIVIMDLPIITPALSNVVDHLWGYFKKEASAAEKEIYLKWKTKDLLFLISLFYDLAGKYDRPYLLHSTIFADFTEPS